jgi:cell wall assembly regulator SMI1
MVRDDGHMSGMIRDAWRGIVTWLERNTPATRASVVEPVPAQRLAGVAEALGHPLPDDLAVWWALHDGFAVPTPGSLFPRHFNPYGVDTMLMVRLRWLDIESRASSGEDRRRGAEQPAGSPAASFLPPFLPIAGDGSGDEMIVDLRGDDARGCIKIYSHEEGALYTPVAPSLAAMLTELLDVLRNGRQIDGWKPEVFAGYLTWSLSGR